MKALVTGARGFLGGHLCRALREQGADVVPAGRATADLGDLDAVDAVWRQARPDVVFHLTSHGVGSPELEQVPGTLRNDLVATVNVLTVAARSGCGRVVLAASLEEPAGPRPVPTSPYAAAKWAASGYARMFHALYATPVVITRPFMTYGPRQRPQKLVPYVIRSLLEGRAPRITSARRLVDWVYVDDVIAGLLAAATRPGIEGGEFDLGSGELVSIGDVVEHLITLVGSTIGVDFVSDPARPREIERRADILATLSGLGWKAETPLHEGLRRTVEWSRAQGVAVGASR